MLFFRFLLGFLYNLAGFQSNVKEVQEKFPAKFYMFLLEKPQILWVLTLTYDVNKIFTCASVANKFVLLDFFSVYKKIFCMKTVGIGNIYHFSG